MLTLDQHLPAMSDRLHALLMREQRNPFPRIQIEPLPGRLLQMLLRNGVDVLPRVGNETLGRRGVNPLG